jgi:uncharacterized protein
MLIALDREDCDAILAIKDDPNCIDPKNDQFKFLFDSRFIVESNDSEINKLMLTTLKKRFSPNMLSLTLAPTKACNFNCPYCYEENRVNRAMSQEVQNGIVDFVKNKYSTIDTLGVVWYGGEPLLEIDIIKYMSSELQKFAKNYSAYLVTNGFYLDKLIDSIAELRITGLQITLDGTKDTHNLTRHLKNGKGTFDKILANIDALIDNYHNVGVSIRMNINKYNSDQYVPLLHILQERFGKRVHLYPAFVRDYGRGCPSGSCYEDSAQKAEFLKSVFDEYGIYTNAIYPLRASKGCMSQKMNAFVIGTEGELYKCWHHLGLDEKIVGSIFDPHTITNYALLSEMMIKNDGMLDSKCRSCVLFPSCHGGCVDEKSRNQDYCIPAKAMLEDFIDIHYAIKTSKKL